MAMTTEQKEKLVNGTLWAVKGLADEMGVDADECIPVIAAAMLALTLKEPNAVELARWPNRHLASYNIAWRLNDRLAKPPETTEDQPEIILFRRIWALVENESTIDVMRALGFVMNWIFNIRPDLADQWLKTLHGMLEATRKKPIR